MLQDLLSDRHKRVVEHEMEIQGLLQSVNSRKQESQGPVQIPSRDDSPLLTAKEDASIPRSTLGDLNTMAGLEKELSNAKEKLELTAKNERESQLELSALQSMMAVQEEELQVREEELQDLQIQLIILKTYHLWNA
ncbi:myomegalin-like isoform X1 [Callithrix jacchus]